MNTETEYDQFVASLIKPGDGIQITPEKANLVHMAIGICGEAGELLDAIKKFVIYNKPLDSDNVMEELGDIEFYMSGFRQAIGATREQTIKINRAKLSERYHQGLYTDQQAQERADKS